MIAFEVANLRLNRATPASALSFSTLLILLALIGNVNLGIASVTMTAIAFINVRISYCRCYDICRSGLGTVQTHLEVGVWALIWCPYRVRNCKVWGDLP